MKFLDDIFECDHELIGFVQRAIGYSLTGSTSEQCLFIMIGDGANGKSTFINVINKLLGLYGSTAASQTLIANGGNSIGDDLVDLIGARLITVSETEEGQSLAEAKIKQMTGGDRLKGRPLYGTHIQFNIIGKLWLATNSLPQINNTDHGIWRRIKAIPFNRTFSAEEQDVSCRTPKKLTAETQAASTLSPAQTSGYGRTAMSRPRPPGLLFLTCQASNPVEHNFAIGSPTSKTCIYCFVFAFGKRPVLVKQFGVQRAYRLNAIRIESDVFQKSLDLPTV
jgi:hypothetical protein